MKLFGRFQSTTLNVMATQLQSLRTMRDYVLNRRNQNEEQNERLLVRISKQLDALIQDHEKGIKRTTNSDSKIRATVKSLCSRFLAYAVGSGLVCITIQCKLGFQDLLAIVVAFLLCLFLISPLIWLCYDTVNMHLKWMEREVRMLERSHDYLDEISGDFDEFNEELAGVRARELVFDTDGYWRDWGFMVVFGVVASLVIIYGMSVLFWQWHELLSTSDLMVRCATTC